MRCLHPLVRACIRSSPRAAQVEPGRGATKESGVPPQPGWEADFASAHPGPRVQAGNQTHAPHPADRMIVLGASTYALTKLLTIDQDYWHGWTIFEILRYMPEHNWSVYEEALKINPVLAKMMVSGVVCSLGNWIAQVHSHVDIYNFSDNTWGGRFDMPKEMAHSHLGMVKNGRYVYVSPQCRGPTARHFVLDTETKEWHDLPPLPVPRYALATQLWRGRLHVMGGSKEDRHEPGLEHWSIAVKDGKALENE
uniref:Uncharacterized protein n=1 Tax=Oryza glumipatula TaxID=40148 RepID=A0A0E0BPH2_9ORYZ